MSRSDSYFVIKNVKKIDSGELRLTGQFILNGGTQIDVSPSSASDEGKSKTPSIRLNFPGVRDVKWILPPRPLGPLNEDLQESYDALQDFAESGGYETVPADDFTYPD